MRYIFRKLNSKEGMSLGEALATVLIMSFVTLAIAAGITAGVRVYHKVTMRAEEQTLLATNVAALSEYLEKGHNIAIGENNSIMIGYSEVSNTKLEIKNGDEGQGIVIEYYDENGQPLLNGAKPLISNKSNTSKLFAYLSEISTTKSRKPEVRNKNNEIVELENGQVTKFKVTICQSTIRHKTDESQTIYIRNTIQLPESDIESRS